jgi:phage-related protein
LILDVFAKKARKTPKYIVKIADELFDCMIRKRCE